MENSKRENSGALFQNKKREKDTHPHYKGEIMYKGELLYLAGWIKESKAGDKYISLAIDQRAQSNEPKDNKKDDFLDIF